MYQRHWGQRQKDLWVAHFAQVYRRGQPANLHFQLEYLNQTLNQLRLSHCRQILKNSLKPKSMLLHRLPCQLFSIFLQCFPHFRRHPLLQEPHPFLRQ